MFSNNFCLYFKFCWSYQLRLLKYFFINLIFTLPSLGRIDNCFSIVNIIFPFGETFGIVSALSISVSFSCFITTSSLLSSGKSSSILTKISWGKSFLLSSSSSKKSYFLLISSSCFYMSSIALSWLGKMALASVTPISAHRSVRALNSRVEPLSEESTSTVKFLYNSMRKFLAEVSFPAKNSRSAVRKGDETNPLDFVRKNFAKSSLRLNFSPNK